MLGLIAMSHPVLLNFPHDKGMYLFLQLPRFGRYLRLLYLSIWLIMPIWTLFVSLPWC